MDPHRLPDDTGAFYRRISPIFHLGHAILYTRQNVQVGTSQCYTYWYKTHWQYSFVCCANLKSMVTTHYTALSMQMLSSIFHGNDTMNSHVLVEDTLLAPNVDILCKEKLSNNHPSVSGIYYDGSVAGSSGNRDVWSMFTL